MVNKHRKYSLLYLKISSNYSVFELFEYLPCLLYTSDAADERSSVVLGGRCIINKKKKKEIKKKHQ